MNPEHEPLSADEERWLDQVLAGGPVAGQDPEAQEFQAFVSASRAKLSSVGEEEWSAVSEGSLVGRVLSATTREDLSWRGELRLVGNYVRERLRSSVLLRVVAASLVLHLAAVPVVALWVVGKPPKPAPILIFEPSVEETLADPVNDELQAPPAQASPGPAAFDNARRRARFVLSQAKGPLLLATGIQESLERKLLRGRSEFLRDRSWQSWWNETNQWGSASGLARVLWVELLLDAYVLEGQSSTELGLYLAELEAAQLAPASDQSLAALRLLVLQRAQAYGLRSPDAGFDPRRVPEPLSREWLHSLRRADSAGLLGELLGDAAFGGWVTR